LRISALSQLERFGIDPDTFGNDPSGCQVPERLLHRALVVNGTALAMKRQCLL
jgi:hypothetical protein